MKNQIITIALLFTVQLIMSQDVITKLNGEKLQGEVYELTETMVKFKTDNTTYYQNILLNKVHFMTFEDGSTKMINEKVTINGAEDWEKVQVVYCADDFADFVAGKEITVKNRNNGLSQQHQKTLHSSSLTKLKQKSAELGYPMVYVSNLDSSVLSKSRQKLRTVSIKAIGYSYN